MNRDQFDQLIASAIAEAEESLGEGRPSPTRLHHALSVLAQRVASATRSYELLNLRTVDDLAEEFGVTRQRIRALAKQRHERFGVGMKFGKSWLWSADEIETMRPAVSGRPRKTQPAAQTQWRVG